jgi:transcriptional regulator with XRE-family HTH domain
MSTQEQWAARFTRAIAAEIRRHREQRGWSAQKLADECAALGLPTQRSTLADLENGRRATLGIAELVVIGRALGVPPLQLLYPVGYEAAAEVLPGVTRDPFRCARWFAGETPFPGERDEGYLMEISGDWNAASGNPIVLYRSNEQALYAEGDALRRARQLDEQAVTGGEGQRDAFTAAAASLRQSADSLRVAREGTRKRAEQLGLLPPRKAAGEG